MDPKDFIRALQFALKDPDIRNDDLSSIIGESVQTEITKLKSELKDNEVVIKKLDTRINDLEKQVESLEQNSRRNCTRLSGLPEVNKDNVIQRTLGKLMRSRVMKARSALKSVSRPLSSALFLNEDPTRQRNNLVFQARRKKKANSLFDVWTLAEAEKLLRSFP
ncbi:hypothetical protein CAPTEDRAFT_193076 [Capitella teleta]|uniref:Uncharacterized protein n=1 Tax=Capitella teleta TaxID=283909 RepID=R7V293_CAPTE|nr:hypothetical protein CAPTEDRAFT_193076 [Capitella teleta]|eukprot:ELU12973.1 hypothetical protein CAPTEDRAFT_193076 [Capitella teleta]